MFKPFKLQGIYFHILLILLEVLFCWDDAQLQVSENY